MNTLMIDIERENSRSMGMDIDFSVSDIRIYEPREKYDAVIFFSCHELPE